MTIIEAIQNPKLFRHCFRDLETWGAWLVLLKALFGLEMGKKDLALYRRCTGRRKAPRASFRELWAVIGRRSGKSYIASIVAVFLALFFDYKKYLAPGERGIVQIIAADRAQARVIFRYITGILHSNPVFEQYIANETKETIELTTGVDIEVATCSFRTVRGRTVVAAILDETAFWMHEGANPSHEILAAVRPSMATIPTSMLFVISSPYARSGILFESYRDYHGKEDPEILAWRAETRLMNPTISEKTIKREMEKDPAAAESEWMAVFRRDIESFLSRHVVEASVIPGRFEISPISGMRYSAFVDPSGGSRDSMTLAISHAERSKRVLDLVREVIPPFSPDQVVEDFANLVKRYVTYNVTGDRYGGEWPKERFRAHGIRYDVVEKPKSDIYRDFLPLINSGEVELLDNQKLLNQLINLERRTARGGRDSIDHPPGGHDDLANAVAGCFVASRAKRRCGVWGSECTHRGFQTI
ncbi:MAG: hypothetical protein GTO24_00860 [candidate division Zixibacteria bacterium]|nr:hypothetical protein [candidate division Zixibacteria bacterium]